MPVLDGLEATKIIRRCGKQYSSILIVALTASAVEGDEQTRRDAEMDGYLAKPVRIQQIKGPSKVSPLKDATVCPTGKWHDTSQLNHACVLHSRRLDKTLSDIQWFHRGRSPEGAN
jgi:CheY-like chemotaxis protein